MEGMLQNNLANYKPPTIVRENSHAKSPTGNFKRSVLNQTANSANVGGSSNPLTKAKTSQASGLKSKSGVVGF